MELPYIHDTTVHNLLAPNKLVPLFMKMFNPSSVVDFGCGIGTFLNVFKQNGVSQVLGLDGKWVNKSLLYSNIDQSSFIEVDLNAPISLERKFDLAICLEVAEHLKPESADNIVHSLVQASDVIIFSAAIPGQGGQNHINEQWPDYWAKKFQNEGYSMLDLIRTSIWDDDDIFWWYRQNLFVVVKDEFSADIQCRFEKLQKSKKTIGLVHPELFDMAVSSRDTIQAKYDMIVSGKCGIKTYIRFFCKAIKRRISK